MTIDITSKGLVHTIDGADAVEVERGNTYSTDEGPLPFDVYRAPGAAAPTPVVVFVSGLPDPGVAAMFGKPIKDWASYVGWARMIAASGMTAIAYANRQPADVAALFRHLRADAARLRIDPARLGVWACSGHGANALGVIARERPACAALLYPYTIDLDGSTGVAEAAARFHFALPPVSLDDLPAEMPLLLVRAGRDETPGLDAALVRFHAEAQARRLPVRMIEQADGPHAFDIIDDTPASRAAIEEVLAFLRGALRP
jgi:hypothetical protein